MNIELFLQIQSDLPRQGPGSFKSTKRAYEMIPLKTHPIILDAGCGPGMQTMDLARLSTDADITAIDQFEHFVAEANRRAKAAGWENRVQAKTGDMGSLTDGVKYDIIWSEGALYFLGVENGLRYWKQFLNADGYVGFTHICWLKKEIATELNEFWMQEYPAISNMESNIESIRRAGFSLIGHFTLPAQDWWTDYYTPLQENLTRYRVEMKNNPEAMELMDTIEIEIDMHRKYSDCYGYEFFVVKPGIR